MDEIEKSKPKKYTDLAKLEENFKSWATEDEDKLPPGPDPVKYPE